MKGSRERRRERALAAMFETRSDAWAAVGLEPGVDGHQVRDARRRLTFTLPLLVATIVAKALAIQRWRDTYAITYHQQAIGKPVGVTAHHWLFSTKAPFEVAAMLVVLALGFLISRDIARITPTFFRRMDPATAGTVEFLTRLVAMAATILGAITIAGVSAQVVAVGGAFSAVVVGLAAQQTLGNLFAGMVLLSAQPFRLGERVRLYAGAIGQQEGTVSSLGLLYVSLARGANRIMIPNNMVLSAVVVPLREPAPVDVRVKLQPGMRPSQAQAILTQQIGADTLRAPEVALEEIDGDDVYIRVTATPEDGDEAARLADEIINALASVTADHSPVGGAER